MLNYYDFLKLSLEFTSNDGEELGLAESFSNICLFLQDNPESLSWRSKNNRPSLTSESGIKLIAQKYFSAFRKSDFPTIPRTVPDEIVGIVLQAAYDYNSEDYLRIKDEHQKAMCAENCVGALLERYLDSVLRKKGWSWCCGDLVRATDFIKKDSEDNWILLQIKNRDNSENSSSSAIRNNTSIQKWFRSYSKTGRTNWINLPSSMKDYDLSEENYIQFVKNYLRQEKIKLNK